MRRHDYTIKKLISLPRMIFKEMRQMTREQLNKMEKRIYETLEEQINLLATRSKGANNVKLSGLTNAMAEIARFFVFD